MKLQKSDPARQGLFPSYSVMEMEGGMEAWKENDLKVEK